eukprot:TRINITY_DN13398_c0_g2_i1.p1 TRINITY_DN13398_c0_g2~~TRINITY_DN13398_c0_g2_i1.p1  ORF type:complete len:154 (+),score=16.07 TRINITY_DN13398_c0_g2_i1:27-464(+)
MVIFGIRYPEQFRDQPRLYRFLERCQAYLIAVHDNMISWRISGLSQKRDPIYAVQIQEPVRTSSLEPPDPRVSKSILPGLTSGSAALHLTVDTFDSQASVDSGNAVELSGVDLVIQDEPTTCQGMVFPEHDQDSVSEDGDTVKQV